jgi:predicted nucleic acid-binding protein
MTSLIDSSVLVALIAESHPQNSRVIKFLETVRKGIIYDHSIFETYRVLTYPNRERGGFEFDSVSACKAIEDAIRHFPLVGLTTTEKLQALFHYAGQRVISARMYDALIGFAGVTHGATEIITLNARNFRSLFPKLKIIDPSQPAESLS